MTDTSLKPAMPGTVQRQVSASPTVTATYQPGKAWAIATGLAVFASINFLDKVVFGMVAVPVMREMGLTPTQFGLIAGSFFWLFSLSAVVVGFIGNRIPARWLLLTMAILWTLIQFPVALASSAAALMASRIILGASEGPGFPVSVHALYKWFPHEKRNLPVSLVVQGSTIGLLLAGLAVPFITREWGWRANFLVLAAASAIWAIGWLCFGAEGKLNTETKPGSRERAAFRPRVPYRRLLTDPTVLSIFLVAFAAYWGLALVLTWLPAYLEKGLGFDGITTGRLFAVIVAVGVPMNLALSWCSQRMLLKEMSSRLARAVFGCVCVIAAGGLFLLLLLPLLPEVKVAVLSVAAALSPVYFTLANAILAEISPDTQRSAILGLNTAIATTAGAIAPVVMGHLIQVQTGASAHGFELGFAVCGVVMITGGLLGLLGQNPARSIRRLWG